MNFDDTPQEAAFRAEAGPGSTPTRRSNMRRSCRNPRSAASGSRAPTSRGRQGLAEEEGRRRLGLPALAEGIWRPRRDADRARDLAAGRGRRSASSRPFIIGHGMCGPTMMAYAARSRSAAICRRSPPARRSGASCSPSRPAAPTSPACAPAPRSDGDDWIINGQKIWTSGAHYSDYGILITRTDPNVPKHKGLTMFFLDMKSPGVEIRPIKQANGMQSASTRSISPTCAFPIAAARRGRRRLERVADHADERADVDRLAACDRFPGAVRPFCSNLMTEDGLAIDDRGRALEARHLGGARQRAEIYQHARDLGAVEGRAPGPENSIGKLVAGSMMQDIAMPMRWTCRARPAC
jgi:hypothetical protein